MQFFSMCQALGLEDVAYTKEASSDLRRDNLFPASRQTY